MSVPRLVNDLRAQLAGPVTLHETHASWVLVGEREALKVKKPVVMPFLDYGTLARRKEACLLEVELNRRLAPTIYLGVVAIVPASRGVVLGDVEDPRAVEYAVRMRRYAEDDTLASRLERDELSAGEIVRVGERIARFHLDVPAVATDTAAESVKRWLDDTFASLRALTHRRRHRVLLAGAERFAAAFMTARWDEFEQRAARGCVRDGHGDLRAEHVLLTADDVVIVDCVEFEPQLRQIDVATDLAFLVMDLHAYGRGDLATSLVDAYRGAGGDPGDDALVAWLASYRALVRAKVMLLRAAQQSSEGAGRSRAMADRLLEVTERLVWQARGPVTVAVGGLSASGKTTLAKALALRAGLPYLSSDVTRKAGAGIASGERADPTLYAPEVSLRLYAQLGARAAQEPRGAIVDATFRRSRERAAFHDAHGATRRVLHVECVAPVALRIARAHARQDSGGAASDAGPDIVRRQTMDPLDEVAPHEHVAVRGDGPLELALAAIADALDRAQFIPGLAAAEPLEADHVHEQGVASFPASDSPSWWAGP
ncbi:MAG: AAA family ATPase [Solirubrobacteraceae bacterium]